MFPSIYIKSHGHFIGQNLTGVYGQCPLIILTRSVRACNTIHIILDETRWGSDENTPYFPRNRYFQVVAWFALLIVYQQFLLWFMVYLNQWRRHNIKIFFVSKRKSSTVVTQVTASFNSSPPSAAYLRRWMGSALVQIMARRLFGAKPLSKLVLDYCQLDP